MFPNGQNICGLGFIDGDNGVLDSVVLQRFSDGWLWKLKEKKIKSLNEYEITYLNFFKRICVRFIK